MLVCNVSQRARRAAIAADLAEVATAIDEPGTGNVVFATLVDDPASVNDFVDAYSGEIMVEAASADTVLDASIPATYAADISEAAVAADTADGVSAAVPNSYSNPGGTGNRIASITITTTVSVPAGNVTMLINGTQADEFWWQNAQSGRELRVDFGTPRNITEAKWYQSSTNSHGDWKWQGSSDGSSWTDIGSSFTLGGVATQTITTLTANTNRWRYYRMLQVSGGTSSGPFLRELEFKIDMP